MSAPTRRGLLGGAAVLAVAPGTVNAKEMVTTTIPMARPDAELLEACAAFDALERAYIASFDGLPEIEGPAMDAHREESAAIWDAQKPLVAMMVASQPKTLAGHAARARSLALWEDDNPSGDVGSEFVNERLLGAILRDLAEVAGT